MSDLHITCDVPGDDEGSFPNCLGIVHSASELGAFIDWLIVTHDAEPKVDLELVLFGHTHQASHVNLPGGAYMNTGTSGR